jgi:transformation/transcription domain-associated protein
MTELWPGKCQLQILVTVSHSFSGLSNQSPVFATSDIVPFRLTPNMQTFLGPIFTEGILASGMMTIGRSLTDPEVLLFSLF